MKSDYQLKNKYYLQLLEERKGWMMTVKETVANLVPVPNYQNNTKELHIYIKLKNAMKNTLVHTHYIYRSILSNNIQIPKPIINSHSE